MKKIRFGSITLVVVIILVVVACCSSTSDKKERPALPHAIRVAETDFGRVSKIVDGKNTIYVYERSGGGSGITVVTND